MSNVPRKGLNDRRDHPLAAKSTKALRNAGRKNPNMGASIRGRQHGGGFSSNQV